MIKDIKQRLFEIVQFMLKKKRHLSKFYYLIVQKSYSKEKNILKSFLTVIYLSKIINTFYKNNLEKSIAMLISLNSFSLMVRLLIKFYVQ